MSEIIAEMERRAEILELFSNITKLDKYNSKELLGLFKLIEAGQLSVKDGMNIADTALNAESTTKDIFNPNIRYKDKDIFRIGRLGLSTKDTITALDLLSEGGLEGDDAVISLYRILDRIESSTKAGVLIKLGFKESFHDKDGKLKRLDGIIQALRVSLKDLNERDVQLQLLSLFGESALRAAYILYQAGDKPRAKLLTITLDDIESVPEVFYRGEEITGRQRVSFDWKTNDDWRYPTHIKLVHRDSETELVNTKTIEHNSPITDVERRGDLW